MLNDKIVYSSETLMRYIRDVDNLLQQKWEALNDKVTNLNFNVEIAKMKIKEESAGVGFKNYVAEYSAPARNYLRVSSLGEIIEAGKAYQRSRTAGAISINNSPDFDAVLLFPIKDKP